MIHELGSNLVPVMAIFCGLVFLALWVVAATVDSMYKTACNTRLKERLIARGDSASDIDRIIKAGNVDAEEEFEACVPPVKAHHV